MHQIERRASALEWQQLRSTFCDGHPIDPPFPRLAANLKSKTVLEQCLKHRPAHDSSAGVTVRFCFNRIALGICPRREALDGRRVRREVTLPAGEYRICLVDQGVHVNTVPSLPVGGLT